MHAAAPPSLPGADAAPPLRAVAIGASAGGIDALTVLLPALPADAAVSVFIVIHLPPAKPSVLSRILQGHCALRVHEAHDKLPIEAGTVYVAPPDYHLLVDSAVSLALSADPPVNYSRPAIDVLFESAADVYGRQLAGIVLTGASNDGAEGLAAIERAGGLALVQDPDSAVAPMMPRAALARCQHACALDLNHLAARLAQLCKETPR
jgi:two-component system chemotaxis response regulator CheB